MNEINTEAKIKEIYERIKSKEYKKGNKDFSYNVDQGYENEYNTLMDYFYYDRLKWCGCGDPIEAKLTVRKFLDAHREWESKEKKLKEYFGVKSVYDNSLLLCLAYTMDAAEFTEHGTSISGAWLTEDGEDFLFCLEQLEDDE